MINEFLTRVEFFGKQFFVMCKSDRAPCIRGTVFKRGKSEKKKALTHIKIYINKNQIDVIIVSQLMDIFISVMFINDSYTMQRL